MYLIDTDTLSELRKRRSGTIDPAIEAWVGSVDQTALHLSVVTVTEIERGIALLERRDPRQAGVLRRWLHDKVVPAFADRILPIHTAIALRRTRLYGWEIRNRDAWIAATGLVHDLTVVTCNLDTFAGTGVKRFNPWATAPEAS